jgi:hypothetical protein
MGPRRVPESELQSAPKTGDLSRNSFFEPSSSDSNAYVGLTRPTRFDDRGLRSPAVCNRPIHDDFTLSDDMGRHFPRTPEVESERPPQNSQETMTCIRRMSPGADRRGPSPVGEATAHNRNPDSKLRVNIGRIDQNGATSMCSSATFLVRGFQRSSSVADVVVAKRRHAIKLFRE